MVIVVIVVPGNSPRLRGLDMGLSRAVDSRNSKFFTDSIGKIGCPELFLSNISIQIPAIYIKKLWVNEQFTNFNSSNNNQCER